MHPSDAIRGSRSRKLEGKVIALGVTGSIAAVETVKLARELIRHGAQVHAVMSPGAQTIIHPYALEFATGNPVITTLTGKVEHVDFVGLHPRAHLLLVAPATANTIGKMVMGIDDTSVTTFATTALGSHVPLMVCPAMDGAMHDQPVVAANLDRLRELGAVVVEPKDEEDKAKMADLEEIVARVLRLLGSGDLQGKRVVVVGGATREPIDDIRLITNRSTGATAVALAREAFFRGAEVELWMGSSQVALPTYIPHQRFETTAELMQLVPKAAADYCLVPAAIADFAPAKAEGKIPTDRGGLTLELRPTPKVIKALREQVRGFLVGFKAEAQVSPEELRERATKRLREWGADLVVANDVAHVSDDEGEVLVVDHEGRTRALAGTKAHLAEALWGFILHGG